MIESIIYDNFKSIKDVMRLDLGIVMSSLDRMELEKVTLLIFLALVHAISESN